MPTTEQLSGDGNKTRSLHSPQDIIEGSEKVYVNGYLRNKDIDYYISYSSPGQLTFYYITPTSQDAIRVDYEYKEPGGTSLEKKEDYAYRLGAETKLFGDKLTFGGSTKQIGIDFTPMGGTSIGLGSRYKEYYVNLNPGYQNLSTTYSYRENNNPIGGTTERFQRTYDNSFSLGADPGDSVRLDLGYRNYRTMDDTPVGTTIHDSDTSQDSLSLKAVPREWQRGQVVFEGVSFFALFQRFVSKVEDFD